MASNLDIVRDAYAAFRRGDLAAFLDLMHPEMAFTEPEELPYGGTIRGKENVEAFFQGLSQYYDEVVVEADELLDAGDRIVGIGRYTLRPRGGRQFETFFAHIWTLRDGLITSYRDFTDKGLKYHAARAEQPIVVAS